MNAESTAIERRLRAQHLHTSSASAHQAGAPGARHAQLKAQLQQERASLGQFTQKNRGASPAAAAAVANASPDAGEGAAAGGRPKFYIETYGCQMNVSDTEIVRSILSAGFDATEDEGDASVILLNTCAIRDNAESKIWYVCVMHSLLWFA